MSADRLREKALEEARREPPRVRPLPAAEAGAPEADPCLETSEAKAWCSWLLARPVDSSASSQFYASSPEPPPGAMPRSLVPVARRAVQARGLDPLLFRGLYARGLDPLELAPDIVLRLVKALDWACSESRAHAAWCLHLAGLAPQPSQRPPGDLDEIIERMLSRGLADLGAVEEALSRGALTRAPVMARELAEVVEDVIKEARRISRLVRERRETRLEDSVARHVERIMRRLREVRKDPVEAYAVVERLAGAMAKRRELPEPVARVLGALGRAIRDSPRKTPRAVARELVTIMAPRAQEEAVAGLRRARARASSLPPVLERRLRAEAEAQARKLPGAASA